MDGPTRSEFDALREQNNALKKQTIALKDENRRIMELVLQNRDDIRQRSAGHQPPQIFGVGDSSLLPHSMTNEGDDLNTAERLTAVEQMVRQSDQG